MFEATFDVINMFSEAVPKAPTYILFLVHALKEIKNIGRITTDTLIQIIYLTSVSGRKIIQFFTPATFHLTYHTFITGVKPINVGKQFGF